MRSLFEVGLADPAAHRGGEKSKVVREHTVVSMFSGCGGMDLGFRGDFKFRDRHYARHPFKIVWANDFNEAACRTYRRNFGAHIHAGDVGALLDTLPKKRVDVVIGGFPCQDVSINGKRAGVDGKRTSLYLAMVEAIKRTKPKIFVAENVPGLLTHNNGKSLQRVIDDFGMLGYNVACDLYQAAAFGVPQTRERIFIVGTVPKMGPRFEPPEPILPDSGDWITAREAIDDLANLPETPEINHIWSRANKSPDQGDRRLIASRPGYTIRAECHGNIQYHYKLRRRISMREAARLQSFPDDFIFEAKLRETERQVGNAVPPVLAWHLAKAVADRLARR